MLGFFALLLPKAAPLLVLFLWAVEQDTVPEVPRYSVTLVCANCAPAVTPQLALSAVLDVTLRPSTQLHDPIAVQSALVYDTGIEPWPIYWARSRAGTLRLRAPVSSLPGLRPGLRQLVFLIGSPYALPPVYSSVLSRRASLQILTLPLEIVP